MNRIDDGCYVVPKSQPCGSYHSFSNNDKFYSGRLREEEDEEEEVEDEDEEDKEEEDEEEEDDNETSLLSLRNRIGVYSPS